LERKRKPSSINQANISNLQTGADVTTPLPVRKQQKDPEAKKGKQEE